jgi:two-component system, cell cycle sensor histidine kinase and response regulator CckA
MSRKPASMARNSDGKDRPKSARRLRVVVVLFVVIFLCFLILDNFRIQTLASIRAFVEGEGLWSKAQKEAVIALHRYARSHDEKDFGDYLNAIQVPLGDHLARLELQKPEPNYEAVDRGLLQGGNHPDDLEGMARLFRRFRHVSYMAAAIGTWTEGDQDIARLQDAAASLHNEISSGRIDPQNVVSMVRQIDEIDVHLTPLENRFSDQMTSGSFMMSYYLTLVVFGFAAMVLAAVAAFSLHLAGQIHSSELSLEVASESLKRSERRFRSLIQDVSDVILVLAYDGTMYYASHSAKRIFGYEPAELVARNIFSLIDAEDVKQFQNCLDKSATQETGSFATEFRLRRNDGSWISLEATGNPMSDDPSAGRTLLTCRDVTERHRLERELGQAQKMEAIGRLAGGIAHDFNNILAIIGGYAEIIVGQLHPQDPLRKSADSVVKTVERGAALTKRLLSFSRKQLMSPRNLDLNAVLDEISKILPRLLGDDIELAVVPGKNIGTIYADAAQLEQVLMNLAVNSRDAMPKGGKLTVRTSNVDFDDSNSSSQSFIVPGSYVLLSVSDTGHGMTVETRNHVFEPFFTTKDQGKGTGLGLSIVYGIVKRSGGYILVESEPNAGTTMKIYFPRVESVPEPSPIAHEPARMTRESGVVLVAEDEPQLRQMICDFLGHSGYTVLEASGAAEAMAKAERSAKPIDILVTDVMMPKMRGPELARILQERIPDLRVVFMSGYTGTSLVREGILEEGTVLVQKPFKLQELAQVIRETLSRIQT